MPKGKPYSAEFKARVVLEALQGAKTVNELAALGPNRIPAAISPDEFSGRENRSTRLRTQVSSRSL